MNGFFQDLLPRSLAPPVGLRLSKPPDGVIHHYAPLAVVESVSGDALKISSCTRPFSPLTNQG